MKINIDKKVKLITPSGSKEELFSDYPVSTIFRQAETYSKNTTLGEAFAMVSKGWGAYLPPELKIEESKTPLSGPSFSKNHLITRSILQDSEIGKKMFNKGTVFNLKTENSYYSVNALYNKKIGEIIVNERLGIDSLKDAKYIAVDKKEFTYLIDKEITDILGSKNEKYKITTSIYMEKGFDLEFVIENEGKTATIKKEISVAYNK